MNWTNSQPTEPGYYWHRNGAVIDLVRLIDPEDEDEKPGPFYLSCTGDQSRYGFETPWFANPAGLWFGPLTPPGGWLSEERPLAS